MVDKSFTREKVQLMLERPFYGALIVRLQLQEWDGNTFATDGEHLFVPKKHQYTSDEIRSALAHETLHCALGHVFRMGDRDQMKWNVAADYAVNLILEQDHFVINKNWLLDKKWSGMHAEKIYSKLPDPIKIQIPIDLIRPGSGGQKQDGKSNSKGSVEVSVQPLSDKDKAEAEAKAKEMEQEWKEYLSYAIEKNRGNLPGGLKELIEDLLFPKISWEEILYKYLQAKKGSTDFSAYPFDRRHIYRDIFLPSMTGDSIEVNVGIDTSGSISHENLINYFSEVRGICSIFGEYTIHLFQCDAALQTYDVITAESDIPKMVQGRGGTDFNPVFNEIDRLELNHLPTVYFTDLDGSFPNQPREDTIWVIEENSYTKKAPWGEVIEIKTNGKKR